MMLQQLLLLAALLTLLSLCQRSSWVHASPANDEVDGCKFRAGHAGAIVSDMHCWGSLLQRCLAP
jgi:hypothetical protein